MCKKTNLLKDVEKRYRGRLIFHGKAQSGFKSCLFEDKELLFESLDWLAKDLLVAIRKGGYGDELRETKISGICNVRSGGDSFEIDLGGYKLAINYHLKNMTQERDRRRVLRIYYGYDKTTDQIVVADGPGHRRSKAS